MDLFTIKAILQYKVKKLFLNKNNKIKIKRLIFLNYK